VVVHHKSPPVKTNPETLHTNELEEIEFTFQKITYTNVSGGKAATDDWEAGS
jgi:hypothetical protein